MKTKFDYLAEINLLTELSAEDIAAIDALVPIMSYPANTIIYEPGDKIQQIFFLKRGRVQLFQVTPEGKQLTLTVLGDGNIFGETDLFATGAGSCYAKTVAPTLVCKMGKADLARFMEQRPRIALKLVEILSQEIRKLQALTTMLVLEDVKTRIGYLLLTLSDQFGQEEDQGWVRIDLKLTHQEVAHLIGATRESVSLVLSEFPADTVQTERGVIRVQPKRLENLLHD
ncbi:Crp/Fnr family transcriptional regulator [Sulfobacillus thermosulfidooxidans]|uniref:Crp/Fnr family transcriptional regulator n=1 Tax=Sulfobacillus thermosulfidooxidans TaxID=28034 RepID=UPI000402A55F|nr:Crp/Fnr family transcriptional regulator [Sulfobacillus thermosulfidooxidans]